MKITKATVNVTSPGRNFVTLKVETDEGIYGLGDGTLNGRELAVASYLTDHVIPCMIGRDPFQTEDLWQYLYRGAYWRRGPVTMSAIAAVDVALWDIKGQGAEDAGVQPAGRQEPRGRAGVWAREREGYGGGAGRCCAAQGSGVQGDPRAERDSGDSYDVWNCQGRRAV